MFWKVHCEESNTDNRSNTSGDGRFVLHRHRDDAGMHVDLRLEWNGALLGWRIAGDTLETGAWATVKLPHATRWLDNDLDAECLDRGVYRWETRSATECRVTLCGANGTRVLTLEQQAVPMAELRHLWQACTDLGIQPNSAAQLIRDGHHARHRAIARLCGLGHELDASAFDEKAWQKTMAGLTLDEIHSQLRAFEVRFDHKYPPLPTSQPAPLALDSTDDRKSAAMLILRG